MSEVEVTKDERIWLDAFERAVSKEYTPPSYPGKYADAVRKEFRDRFPLEPEINRLHAENAELDRLRDARDRAEAERAHRGPTRPASAPSPRSTHQPRTGGA